MSVSTLVITPGSATANAYVSVAVADQYHEDRPPVGETWEDAEPEEKQKAILWATKLLDRYMIWRGYAANVEQRLMWPRTDLWTANGLANLDSTTIPIEIQWATAELARQVLVEDRTGDSDVETQGITNLAVGSIKLGFKDSVYSKPIPDVVVNLIPSSWGYLRNDNGITERELLRA